MGSVTNPDGHVCEEVKWHSIQKHVFLEAYLDIWSENVGKNGKPTPPLSIFDLYSSFGLCYCSETSKSWNGSALLVAECLQKYKSGKLLFLNTYNPNENEQTQQKETLEKNITDLNLPRRIEKFMTTLPIDEAVDSAISHVNPNYPNLWILDPYQPEHLPWDTVEKICKLQRFYTKNGKQVSRRPELFICLMTSRLQRLAGGLYAADDNIVGKALGMEKEEWESKLDHYKKYGITITDALIFMYAEKLTQYYEKKPQMIKVFSNDGAIVYTVFLCTDNNAGHYMMKVNQLPKYLQWQEVEWKKEAKAITRTKKVIRDAEKHGQEQAFLNQYYDDQIGT